MYSSHAHPNPVASCDIWMGISEREKRNGYRKGRENKVMARDEGNGYAS